MRVGIERGQFVGTRIAGTLELDARIGEWLELINIGSNKDGPPAGSSDMRLGPMSVSKLRLQDLDPANIRLRKARDLEDMDIVDCEWPMNKGGQYVLGDEKDLDTDQSAARKVELAYGGLQRNFERRGDEDAADTWYVTKMEFGRKHSTSASTRLVRLYYWTTSKYEHSILRPTVWVLAALALVFGLFMIPSPVICPVVEDGNMESCAGWSTTLRVVFDAVTLQDLPEGVSLQAVLADLVYVLLRLGVVVGLLAVVARVMKREIKR